MAKKKATKKTVTKVVKPQYRASVNIFGRVFTSEGTTLIEAITNLKPTNSKGKCILIIEKDGVKQEKVLPHPMTSRLFGPASGTIKQIILKQVVQRFSL